MHHGDNIETTTRGVVVQERTAAVASGFRYVRNVATWSSPRPLTQQMVFSSIHFKCIFFLQETLLFQQDRLADHLGVSFHIDFDALCRHFKYIFFFVIVSTITICVARKAANQAAGRKQLC
jgi:hypothetical protein